MNNYQHDARTLPAIIKQPSAQTELAPLRRAAAPLKTTLTALALACTLAWVPASLADMPTKGETRDAWLDGKLESALLFNTHLNSFTIDTDVKASTAYLGGRVESAIDRDLAEEIAKSIKGIERVENKLVVSMDMSKTRDLDNDGHPDRSFKVHVIDATLTAKVKSKLLLNENTKGLGINVDTRNGNVVLSGQVGSSTERDLAGMIAQNVDGVHQVDNKLTVVAVAAR